MILILTASIMYWSLQQQAEDAEDSNTPDASPVASVDGERETVLASEVANEEASDQVEGKESPDGE